MAIVESEKSGIITSAIIPDLIWLATGNLNGLSIEKCQVLKCRDVILFPDLNAFEKFSEKAILIMKQCNCKINVSTLLEDIATPKSKANGFDIADFLIEQLNNTKIYPVLEIYSQFSPTLQLIMEKNPAL